VRRFSRGSPRPQNFALAAGHAVVMRPNSCKKDIDELKGFGLSGASINATEALGVCGRADAERARRLAVIPPKTVWTRGASFRAAVPEFPTVTPAGKLH